MLHQISAVNIDAEESFVNESINIVHDSSESDISNTMMQSTVNNAPTVENEQIAQNVQVEENTPAVVAQPMQQNEDNQSVLEDDDYMSTLEDSINEFDDPTFSTRARIDEDAESALLIGREHVIL